MHSLRKVNIYGSGGRSFTKNKKRIKRISSSDKCYALNLFPEEEIRYFKQCKASINIYVYNHEHDKDIKSIVPYEEANEYLDYVYNNFHECYKFLENFNNAEYKRLTRLRQRIAGMFELAQQKNWYVFFITNTFSPEALQRTNEQSRRKAVSRWYEKVSTHYVANIDYGSKHEREHYHGIVLFPNEKIPKELLSAWIKTYGGLKVKPVPIKDLDKTRIAKYITKLSSHALKKSTKQNRMIYSREFQRSPN